MGTEDVNPDDICTWDDDSSCEACAAQGRLNCKWNDRLLAGFLLVWIPFTVMSWFGMAVVTLLTGAWWPLVVYGVFCIAFFLVFEIRILCSHCPYYSRDGVALRCLSKNGALRIWRYHPEPMNRFERVSLIVGLSFFGGFPVLVQAYGVAFITVNYADYSQLTLLGMIGFMVATLLCSITYFEVFLIYICPKCVNFSCPLNRVPKPIVDEYLKMNPVMKEAWEEAGYGGEER